MNKQKLATQTRIQHENPRPEMQVRELNNSRVRLFQPRTEKLRQHCFEIKSVLRYRSPVTLGLVAAFLVSSTRAFASILASTNDPLGCIAPFESKFIPKVGVCTKRYFTKRKRASCRLSRILQNTLLFCFSFLPLYHSLLCDSRL